MGWLNKVSEEAEEEALVKGKNAREREKKGMKIGMLIYQWQIERNLGT